jgi:hypothetical protein
MHEAMSRKTTYRIPDGLKKRIEDFLFTLLPSGVTIAKTRLLSKNIYDIVRKEYDNLNSSESK